MNDYYPSRTDRGAAIITRQDPVVYGAGEYAHALSRAQLARYEDQGFLVLPDLFDAQEVAGLLAEMDALRGDADVARLPEAVIEPQGQEIRSVFRVHELSARIDALARDPRLLDAARQILGSEVYIHQSRINYKPGFKGKGFAWHSDFETWHAEDGMPRMRAVSCSIILTDNHPYNGPLMLIPGSHKFFVPCVGETPDENYRNSLKEQQVGVPDEDSLTQLIERAGGIQSFQGPAGSMLFFECNLLHGSNANMSPDPRSNVFFVYNRRDNACREPYAAPQRRPAFLSHDPDVPWQP